MNSTEQAARSLRDPRVVREPVSGGAGYWVGAPGVFYARDEPAFYLTYRIRRPRGVEPDRGGEARIARSVDLIQFDDVWGVTKDVYGSASIERSAICKDANGTWRYFTSFVDPADGRWCVSVVTGPDVRRLDATRARRLFTAAPLGLEGVKDPWLFEDQGIHYMVLSVATPTPRTAAGSHATLDIFNTGDCVSATGLARSRDLESWEWLGVVFAPEASGWDTYCRRINSIVRHNGTYLGFYDGSASHLENYEEKTGLAVSTDLRSWTSLTSEGPALTSPSASGSLRYLDLVASTDRLWTFYEWARDDGAHDLRIAPIDLDRLLTGIQSNAVPR
jgi:hypothetical protein